MAAGASGGTSGGRGEPKSTAYHKDAGPGEAIQGTSLSKETLTTVSEGQGRVLVLARASANAESEEPHTTVGVEVSRGGSVVADSGS